MGKVRARTYKLRLSAEGIRHFLDCHHRLAVLLGEMIPYGATLFVAMMLLARMPAGQWLDLEDECVAVRWKGSRTYFVGYSHRVAELTSEIAATRAADHRPTVPVALLYLLALRSFEIADDCELLDAYPGAVGKSDRQNS